MSKAPKKRNLERVSLENPDEANAVLDVLGVLGSIPLTLEEPFRLLDEMRFLSKKINQGSYLNRDKDVEELRRLLDDYSIISRIDDRRIISYGNEIISLFKSSNIDIFSKSDSEIVATDETSLTSSIDERLVELEAFAKRSHGEGVADFARHLFPELGRGVQDLAGQSVIRAANLAKEEIITLPLEAPKRWSLDREGNETPPEFIVRVYDKWMGKGLTMADIRRLDEPLAQSLYHHIRKDRPMPEGFDLPTKHQQRDRAEAVTSDAADISRREYLRTKQARYRQNRRETGSDTQSK